ncbi:hypothetical protein MXAN_0492 [Myxococcus xanthus DK 1622]|uniref:Uncharacterized protein n=1 Tax=Myxococcus xanthus (strain DK1622) TaxID=246197 RepID=Q1DF11_MYXXD|nr:hypothetical protein MXAN_0492 [Myxococcus xanthus DK 1622]
MARAALAADRSQLATPADQRCVRYSSTSCAAVSSCSSPTVVRSVVTPASAPTTPAWTPTPMSPFTVVLSCTVALMSTLPPSCVTACPTSPLAMLVNAPLFAMSSRLPLISTFTSRPMLPPRPSACAEPWRESVSVTFASLDLPSSCAALFGSLRKSSRLKFPGRSMLCSSSTLSDPSTPAEALVGSDALGPPLPWLGTPRPTFAPTSAEIPCDWVSVSDVGLPPSISMRAVVDWLMSTPALAPAPSTSCRPFMPSSPARFPSAPSSNSTALTLSRRPASSDRGSPSTKFNPRPSRGFCPEAPDTAALAAMMPAARWASSRVSNLYSTVPPAVPNTLALASAAPLPPIFPMMPAPTSPLAETV